MVLDEATSALDTVTENSVQEALERLGSDRTVLVIAHRLGTIKDADNIIVLGDGVVAEEVSSSWHTFFISCFFIRVNISHLTHVYVIIQGTHEELLQNGGKYAEMWNMQLHSVRGNNSSSNSLTGLDAFSALPVVEAKKIEEKKTE